MKHIKNFFIETIFLTVAVIAWCVLKVYNFASDKSE